MLIDTKADVKSDLQGKNFNFELNGKTFKALFSDIYTDKIGSVVREIASNCRDSHVEADKADVPFDIKIGSDGFGSNIISFTDYGVGMSKRDIKKLFTSFFSSTKDKDNNAIGGFGIGSKSPLAYTNQFTVTSIKDNKKNVAVITKIDNVPQYSLVIDDYPTDSENMTVVTIPIEDKDVGKFLKAIKEQLWLFNPLPNVEVDSEDFSFDNRKLIFEDGDVSVYYNDSKRSPEYNVFIDIGGIPYIFVHNKSFAHVHKYFTVVYKQPIGKYELTLSRESISLSVDDKENIFSEINRSVNRFQAFIEKQDIDYWLENRYMFASMVANNHTKIKDFDDEDFEGQGYRFGSSDVSNTICGRFGSLVYRIADRYKVCFVKNMPHFKTMGRVCTGILKRFVKHFDKEKIVVVFVDAGFDKRFELLKRIANVFECDIVETTYSDYKNVVTHKPTKINNQKLTDHQIGYKSGMVVSTRDINKPYIDFSELTENDIVFVAKSGRKNVFKNYSTTYIEAIFGGLKKCGYDKDITIIEVTQANYDRLISFSDDKHICKAEVFYDDHTTNCFYRVMVNAIEPFFKKHQEKCCATIVNSNVFGKQKYICRYKFHTQYGSDKLVNAYPTVVYDLVKITFESVCEKYKGKQGFDLAEGSFLFDLVVGEVAYDVLVEGELTTKLNEKYPKLYKSFDLYSDYIKKCEEGFKK